jgi:hypothetical protein
VPINHEEYLKQVLETKKMELQNLNINRRIAIGVYEAKKEMFMSQIHSIEKQLDTFR